MTNNKITLQDYETLLKNHDWYYMMSEDSHVYRIGSHSYSNIKQLSDSSEKHLELFNQYQNKHKIN